MIRNTPSTSRNTDKKYTFDIEKYLNRRMKLKKDEVFDVVEA